MMTSKTAKNADSPKHESFLMECVVKPMVKKLSGLLVVILAFIAIVTYVGTQFPNLFPQQVTISDEVIENKLQTAGEMVTAKNTLSGVKTWGAPRTLPLVDVAIPGTYTELRLAYTCTVHVGYDFSEIKAVRLDDSTVLVTLPEARVLGEYLETDEDTDISLFNRIPEGTVDELKAQAKADGMEAAVNNGIYEEAEAEAQKQIKGLLSEIGDFEVIFE